MKIVPVAYDTELEIVIATALYDRRVTHVDLWYINASYEFLVGYSGVYSFRELCVLYFLCRKDRVFFYHKGVLNLEISKFWKVL